MDPRDRLHLELNTVLESARDAEGAARALARARVARPLNLNETLLLTLVLSHHHDRRVYCRAFDRWVKVLCREVDGVPKTHATILWHAFDLLPAQPWLAGTILGAVFESGGEKGLALEVREWWDRQKPPDDGLPF